MGFATELEYRSSQYKIATNMCSSESAAFGELNAFEKATATSCASLEMNFAFSTQLTFFCTNERDVGFPGDKHPCELGHWAGDVPHHRFWVRLGQGEGVSFQILTRISIFCWIPETPQGKSPSYRECASSEIPPIQR